MKKEMESCLPPTSSPAQGVATGFLAHSQDLK